MGFHVSIERQIADADREETTIRKFIPKPGELILGGTKFYRNGFHNATLIEYEWNGAGPLARLLEAAPDLLSACEYVVRYHREHDSGEGELFGLDFVTTCIAAIKKAKGE